MATRMLRPIHWLLLLALVGGAIGAYWQSGSGGDSLNVTLRPDDRSIVDLGRRIYAENCASCHGALLEGQPDWRERGSDGRLPAPPHDENGHTWHHPDSYLFAMTKHGIETMLGRAYPNNMPAYDGVLSDDEIVAVLSYIKSRWPAPIREQHDQINARANAG